jgi:hypothetical protein
MKKIVAIYKDAAELAYTVWSARMDVRVWGIEELEGKGWDGESRGLECSGLLQELAGDGTREESVGKLIRLVTRSMVEFYGGGRDGDGDGDGDGKNDAMRVVQRAGVYWDDVGCEAQTVLFDPALKTEVMPEWI